MLRQYCRRGRLEALLHSTNAEDGQYTGLAKLFDIEDTARSKEGQTLSNESLNKTLKKSTPIPTPFYKMILRRLNQNGGNLWKAHSDYPHDFESLVLSPNAEKLTQVLHEGKTFSTLTSHEGNSGIQFWNALRTEELTGNIMIIYGMLNQGNYGHFLFVQLHQKLPVEEERKAPYLNRPEYRTQIVDAELSNELTVIRLHDIITHLAVYPRPAGTFGIARKTKLISWSLDRGRKG